MSAQALPPDDVAKLDSACARAMRLQLAGQLDLARQLYSDILQAYPGHAAANYCLGMLHVQSRRVVDGLPYLKAALQARLDVVDYWLGYLEALTLAGQTEAARNILALGLRQGIAGKAVDEFAERLAAPPATRRRKGATRPRNERDTRKLESTLLSLVERRDNPAALELARDLTEWFPNRGFGWKILGALMTLQGDREETLAILRNAVRLTPGDAEAHINLGLTLAQSHRTDEAEIHLLKAIDLDPTSSAAYFRLAMTYELQGRNADAEACLRRGRAMSQQARKVAGDDMLSYSHLLFIMSQNPAHDAGELYAEHVRFGQYVEGPLRSGWPQHANQRDAERRLKVGFVSGDLHDHSVGHFLEPILAHLATRSDLELLAYCTNLQEDPVNRRLRELFDTHTSVGTLQDAPLAARIIEDGIDVLIDLSGHTGFNRLPVFARKPAPVQVSWLGYPGTTGLAAMDYYLADPCWLPPGRFDSMFTERLVYLPDRWAFIPHPSAPATGPPPALSTGRLTFGSFHRLAKMNVETIRLWSQLLLAVPGSTLLMVGIRLGEEARLVGQFAAHGIPRERLELQERSTMERYLAFHNQVDIALDTLAYSGATTTMHSLSMGVPTLTLAGSTPQGRACAGILAHLELDSFIAIDADDFVAKGRYWAAHPADLAMLRPQLRSRLLQSPGGDPALIAQHVHQSLRHMWRRWCEGLPAESFHSTVAAPATALSTQVSQ
jgi:predicted O-linked N-acetylglucosamine transferase (SPINDLY family)